MNSIPAVELAKSSRTRATPRPTAAENAPRAEPTTWQDRLAALTIVGFVLALAYLFWFA